MLTRNAEKKELNRLEAQLWQPPPSERGKPIHPNSPWAAENERNSFNNLVSSLTGAAKPGTVAAEPRERKPPRTRTRADGTVA